MRRAFPPLPHVSKIATFERLRFAGRKITANGIRGAMALESRGVGAFDAGVNAFSLLHAIMQVPLIYQQGDMAFAAGAETPIRVALRLSAGADKIPVKAWFDIGAEADDENWTITCTLKMARRSKRWKMARPGR